MAASERFELPLKAPETLVLPLHQEAKEKVSYLLKLSYLAANKNHLKPEAAKVASPRTGV